MVDADRGASAADAGLLLGYDAAMKKALGERLGSDHRLAAGEVIGAVDVGSNAARLKLARVLEDGSFEQVHQERDPIRPGEGVWESGAMPEHVVERLVETLTEYRAIARRWRVGHLRAVATSALREAKNQAEVVARVRDEAGIELEVISGKEEARLICLGVLRGMPLSSRTLLIDIGGGSTEMARAEGEEPTELWSVALGSVRLTEMFATDESLTRERLTAIRRYAQRAIQEQIPTKPAGLPRHALGSSGTIRAVCAFAAQPGSAHATRDGLSRAVEELVALGPSGRRRRFDAQRAQVLVAGAVILESLAHHLRIDSVTAVDGGLKEGLLVDLVRRSHQRRSDPLLSEAVLAAGRKFSFDEAHAVFVRDTALSLYDQLEPLHQLPPDARMILEAAAVLHDVGNVVSRSRHHKHSMYLMANMDLPGLSDHERGLAAIVARFHRRSPPKRDHAALAQLNDVEFRLVRKLAVLVRLADAADRSRQQPIAGVDVVIGPRHAHLRLRRAPKKQLDAADLLSEEALFAAAFGRRLLVDTDRARRKRA